MNAYRVTWACGSARESYVIVKATLAAAAQQEDKHGHMPEGWYLASVEIEPGRGDILDRLHDEIRERYGPEPEEEFVDANDLLPCPEEELLPCEPHEQ